jgi:hypothetical protein
MRDNSNRANTLTVANFFNDADKKWMHMCATIANNGVLALYKNGTVT